MNKIRKKHIIHSIIDLVILILLYFVSNTEYLFINLIVLLLMGFFVWGLYHSIRSIVKGVETSPCEK